MKKYSCDDVINLYKEIERDKGNEAYKYIQELFDKAKIEHEVDFRRRKPDGVHEQSWHTFVGKCFEELVRYIIQGFIEKYGFKIVSDKDLNKRNLSKELDKVKRNVVVNFGKFGMQLPDADIIIFNPLDFKVIVIISCKTSLAERVAQTGYWKIKLLECNTTKNIKVFLITTDNKKHLKKTDPPTKSRVIAEFELDGSYVLTKDEIAESDKVKLFEHFIDDLKRVIEENR